jgi:hypothetical protein
MTYSKIYHEIVGRCKTRKYNKDIYYEKHHIIPKCVGGKDNDDNIVSVTAREHFILHHLLAKEYVKQYKDHKIAYNICAKLVAAFNKMCIHHTDNRKINSRQFERARKLFSEFHPMKNTDTKNMVSEKLKIFNSKRRKERMSQMKMCANCHIRQVRTKYAKMCSKSCFYESRKGSKMSTESNLKRSVAATTFINSLTEQQKRDRLLKNLHSNNIDHTKRNISISLSKKNIKTNQQKILQQKLKRMTDYEFVVYLKTISSNCHKRSINLRNKNDI